MAAKNGHEMRFWNDSYVQCGFIKVIGCDKLDNAQCTLCNTIWATVLLKLSKLKRLKELKHKENKDSVEMFKAKRAGNAPCVRLLPNFPTTPARFI